MILDKQKKIGLLAFCIFMFVLSSFNHVTLQNNYELGWEERVLFNTIRGRFYLSDDQSISGLGSHFHVFPMVVNLPLYYLFDNSFTLLFIQVAIFALSAVLLFFFSKKYVGLKGANIVFYSFLFFPLVINILLEGMHQIVFSIPLIMGIFLAVDERKKSLVYLLSLLLILVQEDMSLIVIMMGLYFTVFKNRVMGLRMLFIGIIAFILIPNIIQPALIQEHGFASEGKFLHYTYKYGYLGDDAATITKTIITNPEYAFTYTPFSQKILFVNNLLSPLLFLSLLSPIILISLPIILEIVLHSSVINVCANSYHVSSIIPLLFISMVVGLSIIKKFIGMKWIENILKLILIVVIIFLVFGEASHWFTEGYFNNKNFFGGVDCMKPEFKFFPEHRYYFVSQDKQTMNAIKSVPKDSSKLVPFHLYAFFAGSHDNVKTFFESRTCFDFDYIILDKQDLFFHSEAGFDSFLFLILEKSYLVEFNKKDVYILKKNVKGEVCI